MSTQGDTAPQGGMRRGNGTRYVLLAVLAVAFLATGGIFVRQSGLSPINTGMYRMPLIASRTSVMKKNDSPSFTISRIGFHLLGLCYRHLR